MKLFCDSLKLVLAIGILFVTDSFSQSKDQPVVSPEAQTRQGEALFQQMCAACHTIGGGKRVGPDLKDVTQRRNRDWLVRIIVAPDKMLAEGDPIASKLLKEFGNIPMPNLKLSEAQAYAILAHLDVQSSVRLPLPPETKVIAGNPLIGKDLFTGTVPFQKGGPPCMACHNIADAGGLGGGTLGPDLTEVYEKYGEEGLLSALKAFPFPTMKPIYDNRPLTADEQTHLKSLFEKTAGLHPGTPAWKLSLIAAGGFLVLIVLVHLIWKARLVAVRRPLVKEATREEA